MKMMIDDIDDENVGNAADDDADADDNITTMMGIEHLRS